MKALGWSLICIPIQSVATPNEGRTEVYTEWIWYALDKTMHVGAHSIHGWDLGSLGLVMDDTCASGGRNDTPTVSKS